MASSPVVQIPSTTSDLYGASIVTATRASSSAQLGTIYDNTELAAGSPVHFHPLTPTKFLVAFSRRWTAATPSATQVGFYSSYTEDLTPTWFIAGPTGARSLVSSTPSIPVQTPADTVRLRAGCSRAPGYIYLLHTATTGGVPVGLLQHFILSVTGRIVPMSEEIIPSAGGAVFDKGVALTTPNITVFGSDSGGNVYQVRKPWGAIGVSSSFSTRANITTSLAWQYGTAAGGWDPDPANAGPEPGLTTTGPVSYTLWRANTRYLAVTKGSTTMTAQVYTQKPGQPWIPQGAPVALGSTADGSYLGGTLQLQPMLGSPPATVDSGSATAFPYVTAVKQRVSSQDRIQVNWGNWQVPHQT